MKEESKEPNTETGTEQEPVATAAARQNDDAPVVAPRKSSRGTGVGWLALLLAIAAMGLSGWMYYQSTLVVAERSDAGAALDAALSSQRQDAATLRRENDATLDRLREEIAAIQLRSDEQLAGLSAALQTQRQQLLEVNSTDRSDWMLAEAEYLLRLANQRWTLINNTFGVTVEGKKVMNIPERFRELFVDTLKASGNKYSYPAGAKAFQVGDKACDLTG